MHTLEQENEYDNYPSRGVSLGTSGVNHNKNTKRSKPKFKTN